MYCKREIQFPGRRISFTYLFFMGNLFFKHFNLKKKRKKKKKKKKKKEEGKKITQGQLFTQSAHMQFLRSCSFSISSAFLPFWRSVSRVDAVTLQRTIELMWAPDKRRERGSCLGCIETNDHRLAQWPVSAGQLPPGGKKMSSGADQFTTAVAVEMES
jgi:Na+/H+ antiporter NhaD/arsenite permease-like protein